jgi:predicted membrane-bound spermidine synthase
MPTFRGDHAQAPRIGFNLIGSLLGMLMMFGVSFLWFSPLVWFGLTFLVLLRYLDFKRTALGVGALAIMGSGSGNDVAAAIRMGAREIDAVEIDPVIAALGTAYHPEHPYQDERVWVHITDARTFIRNTEKHYDLLVIGLLDSHTVLSQASSVRLDSFVYTTQGFREALHLLKEDGII